MNQIQCPEQFLVDSCFPLVHWKSKSFGGKKVSKLEQSNIFSHNCRLKRPLLHSLCYTWDNWTSFEFQICLLRIELFKKWRGWHWVWIIFKKAQIDRTKDINIVDETQWCNEVVAGMGKEWSFRCLASDAADDDDLLLCNLTNSQEVLNAWNP